MDIGVPENKPPPDGLTNIDTQHGHGTGIADKPDDNSRINNAFQFLTPDNIGEKPGKKCTGSQTNHRQIKNDPQGKSKYIAHIGLV